MAHKAGESWPPRGYKSAVPSKIQVKEIARRINDTIGPPVWSINNNITWPRGIDDKVVEHLDRSPPMKVDSDHLIRGVTFNPKLGVTRSLIICVLEDSAKSLVTLIRKVNERPI